MSPIRCYHSGPEWTWERWQWRGTPHSPKLQHCWNLTIRLFSVISGHSLGGESYPSEEMQLVYSTAPVWYKCIMHCQWFYNRNELNIIKKEIDSDQELMQALIESRYSIYISETKIVYWILTEPFIYVWKLLCEQFLINSIFPWAFHGHNYFQKSLSWKIHRHFDEILLNSKKRKM